MKVLLGYVYVFGAGDIITSYHYTEGGEESELCLAKNEIIFYEILG
jgi:hypothetical protein